MWQKIARRRYFWLVSVVVCLWFTEIQAQSPATSELLGSLRQGGQYIVMRHAHSPHKAPDKSTANPDNATLQRQLDETGRATAAEMGRAMRELGIPVTTVMSSPTYRALETVTLAKWPTPKIYKELGNAAEGMRAVSADETKWLRQQVTHWPTDGNTVIVTHSPNISGAFPEYVEKMADGEALILARDGNGGIALLARIRIEDWSTMASQVEQ